MTTTTPPNVQPPAHSATDHQTSPASGDQAQPSQPTAVASQQAASTPSKLSDFASLLMRAGM